ncbi:hypothetical protein K458DRAFT_396965 [Lentithecium fluviatile CBS 122367]|uniref:Uncharacterized protein n=1 Tax=Lentithecium fluviatile CBS 122367 TaxID=1168545 RepID=A0A6G1IER2_9PLEO|nr:hypothetical protein K458DRAFT_396965 [Lentithecium fluviatile CBS 122367]
MKLFLIAVLAALTATSPLTSPHPQDNPSTTSTDPTTTAAIEPDPATNTTATNAATAYPSTNPFNAPFDLPVPDANMRAMLDAQGAQGAQDAQGAQGMKDGSGVDVDTNVQNAGDPSGPGDPGMLCDIVFNMCLQTNPTYCSSMNWCYAPPKSG